MSIYSKSIGPVEIDGNKKKKKGKKVVIQFAAYNYFGMGREIYESDIIKYGPTDLTYIHPLPWAAYIYI